MGAPGVRPLLRMSKVITLVTGGDSAWDRKASRTRRQTKEAGRGVV